MTTKIKIILFTGTFLLFTGLNISASTDKSEVAVKSENSGLGLTFGPAVSYFQGAPSTSFESFDDIYLNFQVNSYLGYFSARSDGKNSFGIFGSAGYANYNTILKNLELQNIDITNLKDTNFNFFYQAEVGMVVANVLRLSSGIGTQFYSETNSNKQIDYFSTTGGLLVRIGTVMWNFDANFNYGRDYSSTIVKFSTGIMFLF